MFFQILSHAGLRVNGAGKSLVFDPWLVGSAYWRAWWNYPPVSPDLVAALKPDFIYLTHIHWDHFQGPSLRKFPLDTPILVPRGNVHRMKKDLNQIGFKNVREIRHGETVELAPGFTITSYQFYPFTDSAAVVSCEGVTLLNSNDAKFMGGPLDQILARHPKIDFVFRSHSSANPRAVFDSSDAPEAPADEGANYAADFAAFAQATGARHAVPFASNHCFLHKDVFDLNASVTTPLQVEEYFRAEGIASPELKVMVSGDSWDSGRGFEISDAPWFRDRARRLEEYRDARKDVLEKFYAQEARAQVSLAQVERYFRKFIAALPWAARWLFRGKPVTYVVTGAKTSIFRIDLWRGTVSEANEIEAVNDVDDPLQIHTSTFIFKQCMALDLFLHLGISKRVRFRSTRANAKYHWLLELLFNLYESEMLPWRRMLSPRFVMTWVPRWREILLYLKILARKAVGKPFRLRDYLPPPRAARANAPERA